MFFLTSYLKSNHLTGTCIKKKGGDYFPHLLLITWFSQGEPSNLNKAEPATRVWGYTTLLKSKHDLVFDWLLYYTLDAAGLSDTKQGQWTDLSNRMIAERYLFFFASKCTPILAGGFSPFLEDMKPQIRGKTSTLLNLDKCPNCECKHVRDIATYWQNQQEFNP